MKRLWCGSRTDGDRKASAGAAPHSDRSPPLRSLHALHAASDPQTSGKKKVSLRQTLTCVCRGLNFGLFPWQHVLNPATASEALFTPAHSLLWISALLVSDKWPPPPPPQPAASLSEIWIQDPLCNEQSRISFCFVVFFFLFFWGGGAWNELFAASLC